MQEILYKSSEQGSRRSPLINHSKIGTQYQDCPKMLLLKQTKIIAVFQKNSLFENIFISTAMKWYDALVYYNKREMQFFFRLFITRGDLNALITKWLIESCHLMHRRASFYMLHFCNLFLNNFLGRLINHDSKTNAYLIPISYSMYNIREL